MKCLLNLTNNYETAIIIAYSFIQAQARYSLISRVLEFLRTAPTDTQAYALGLTNVPSYTIRNPW